VLPILQNLIASNASIPGSAPAVGLGLLHASQPDAIAEQLSAPIRNPERTIPSGMVKPRCLPESGIGVL
jgi:hypothetical protein